MSEAPVILVTGASKGIGRAIALRAASAGARLVLSARNNAKLEEVARAARDAGSPATRCTPLDLENADQIATLFSGIASEYGRLDGLVNNAGVMHEGLLGMIPLSDINRVLAINVRAPVMMMQYASRLMARKKSGSIVNITSIMGTNGAPGLTLYSASKAALIGATRAGAKELARNNVRVNAIAPGFIDTDMTGDLPEAAHAARVAQIGLGRTGSPSEVAELAWFLLSPTSGYISGQVIGIDGQMVL